MSYYALYSSFSILAPPKRQYGKALYDTAIDLLRDAQSLEKLILTKLEVLSRAFQERTRVLQKLDRPMTEKEKEELDQMFDEIIRLQYMYLRNRKENI